MLQPPATTSRSFLIPLVLGMMQVELSNNCRSSAVFISSHIHQAILQIHQLDIVHKHSNLSSGFRLDTQDKDTTAFFWSIPCCEMQFAVQL